MAGRIRQSDIEEVRARTNIADVIGEQVTLKPAGVGSLKGLCPFHDERSPSFNVRPAVGRYHCFGCGESGDVYSFLQKLDHVTFVEAVERLAARIGFQLTYEDGGPAQDAGNRVRLLDANKAAAEFFAEQLATSAAEPGQRFLAERGFDQQAAAQFGLGWAPKSWDALTKHLRGRGYTDAELQAAGLVSKGDRGVYDRFRGRLVWPIRDLTNATLGFGARRLLDDDQGPKYLNTPETLVYHKSQVLYGLDLAKRDIGRTHRVVVVEGYTDVMALHLAGEPTAVATCGTAFGVDHIKVLRRVLGDDSASQGEVIFTFDPDAAGQKAAVRAFAEERRFSARTSVAVGGDGLDPCDLRQQRGDAAVRQMLEARKPMFEFILKRILGDHDLDTVEGRAAALRAAAPVVADIRDPGLRPGYTRELARWLGLDVPDVERVVGAAGRSRTAPNDRPPGRGDAPATAPVATRPAERPITLRSLPNDPATRLEREALLMIVQVPHLVGGELIVRAATAGFANKSLAVVRDAIASQLGALGGAGWLERLVAEVPPPVAPLVQELAFLPLPARTEDEEVLRRIAQSTVAALVDRHLLRQKAELVRQLQRSEGSADPERLREIRQRLVGVEADRRLLRGA
ncbi:DNA primase [Amnibacterium sp. CER49]|uniref:DNA primase n=1 Tax=Amnibacterium sp. CER49 TaxID=3039161 RepID=UPI002446B644|nr:DNA primase [Amnibacterium sp. CER49]MDH2442417.1 DNA primase [Amnibacterium sp. CER49]